MRVVSWVAPAKVRYVVAEMCSEVQVWMRRAHGQSEGGFAVCRIRPPFLGTPRWSFGTSSQGASDFP